MHYRVARILGCLLGGMAACGASAADWPFFRGPNLNGTTPEADWSADWPDQGPRILWQMNVGVGASGVVTRGDRAITMGNVSDRDVIVCVDAESGRILWRFDYACPYEERMFEGGTASTPTIDGDRVYALSHAGHVHCLSLDSGAVIWKRHLVNDFGGRPARWKYSGSPLIVENMVIFDTGARGDSTLALDKRTGDKIWGRGNDRPGYATPIPYRGPEASAVLVFKAQHLVAQDLATGREWWRVPWETSYDVNASTPVVQGDRVLVSSGYRSGRTALFDISGREARQIWRNDDLKTKMNSSVLFKGHVYGISERFAQLMCLDAATGRTVWAERGFGQYGTLIIAGDRIVALAETGDLVVAQTDPDRYIELARAKVLNGRSWVAPTLSHGYIFSKNNQGDVVCIDVRT